jgi:hypothetical protein
LISHVEDHFPTPQFKCGRVSVLDNGEALFETGKPANIGHIAFSDHPHAVETCCSDGIQVLFDSAPRFSVEIKGSFDIING